jgi:hypothetical protein
MNLPDSPAFPLKGYNYRRVVPDMRLAHNKQAIAQIPPAHKTRVTIARPGGHSSKKWVVSPEAAKAFNVTE